MSDVALYDPKTALGGGTNGEVIRGELVDGPEPDPTCRLCGSHFQQGPEKDRWARHFHCWKCGFTEGQQYVNAQVQAQAFDWQRMQDLIKSVVADAMNSPQQQAVEALAAQLGPQGIADLQAQEAARLQANAEPVAVSGLPPDDADDTIPAAATTKAAAAKKGS